MDKLTKKQEEGIYKLLHHTHEKEYVQYVLNTIGKENWTRDILSECSLCNLTDEQITIFENLGGYYTSDEMDVIFCNDDINSIISEKLKEQGVTKNLYENEEYLDEIREGKIVCEGIDVDEIKRCYLI